MAWVCSSCDEELRLELSFPVGSNQELKARLPTSWMVRSKGKGHPREIWHECYEHNEIYRVGWRPYGKDVRANESSDVDLFDAKNRIACLEYILGEVVSGSVESLDLELVSTIRAELGLVDV